MKLKYEKKNHKYAQAQQGVMFNQAVKRSFAAFVAMVVLLTSYALILPAKTESIPECGITEHIHSEECYSITQSLICEDITDEHIHIENCYTEEKSLVCETEVHAHKAECFAEISDEPAVGGGGYPEGAAVDEETAEPQPPVDLSQYTDFEEFLAIEDVEGSIESSLFDGNNNYIEHIYDASGANYTYMLHMRANYVLPDTYIYYLPEGMTVDVASKTGEISNGTSSIGTYKISDDCTYILFTFGEDTVHYQTIRGEISLKVEFEEMLDPAVEKKGYYISDDGVMDGYFHFEVNAFIPASREGAPKREWRLIDRSEITDMWEYDFDNETQDDDVVVSISYDDVENEEIFNIKEVYKDDTKQIAYYVNPDTKVFYLANRCKCDESDSGCANVKSGGCKTIEDYDGWCTCWSVDKNVKLTIKYKNAINGADGTPILSNQNELASNGYNQYENKVTLYNSYIDADGVRRTESEKSASIINFSNMIEKTESKKATSEEGYESIFTITLNPEKADFSKIDADGDKKYDKKIIVLDTMKNLKYIPGSMKITTEDTEGNQIELEYGKDFEVTNVHTADGSQLAINLLKLGRYKYIIDYSTTVYNEGASNLVEIENYVSIDLYGHSYEYSDPTYKYSRTFIYEDDWDYLRYYVNILKVDYYNKEIHLPNAEFGLYTADGYLMATAVTDEDGRCRFETNAAQGLIFHTDSMYYISEITAPEGYELNSAKYWFYFSESQNEAMEAELENEYSGANIRYVSLSENKEYVLDLEVTNEKLFVLPATGGTAQNVFIVAGVIVLAISFGCIIIKNKNKKEALKYAK